MKRRRGLVLVEIKETRVKTVRPEKTNDKLEKEADTLSLEAEKKEKNPNFVKSKCFEK